MCSCLTRLVHTSRARLVHQLIVHWSKPSTRLRVYLFYPNFLSHVLLGLSLTEFSIWASRWCTYTQRRSNGARPTYVRPYSCRILRMAMRQPGPPEVRRSGRRSWIQIPILLLLMKVFYNEAKRSEIGHVRIGIGLRISGRTSLILQTRGSTGALFMIIHLLLFTRHRPRPAPAGARGGRRHPLER